MEFLQGHGIFFSAVILIVLGNLIVLQLMLLSNYRLIQQALQIRSIISHQVDLINLTYYDTEIQLKECSVGAIELWDVWLIVWLHDLCKLFIYNNRFCFTNKSNQQNLLTSQQVKI